jgi:transforming growth factor-beta-induced protein
VLIGNTTTAERAKATPATETLATAVGAAGLESTLDGGEFTVFAPVNAAFSGVDVAELLEDDNEALLEEILTYHVVSGQTLTSDIAEGESTLPTVEGGTLTVNKTAEGAVTVNGKSVTTADIQTTNGVIHLIDGPLLETLDVASYASVNSSTNALTAAVTDAGLAGLLDDGAGPLTVFAPTNAAFDALDANGDGEVNGDELSGALRERVLKYHVVGENIPLTGAGLMDGATRVTLDDTGMENQSLTFSVEDDSITAVNGADIAGTVEVADGNATIHLLNKVLLQSTNIVERAQLDPNLTSLVDAVTTGDLVGTLGDENSTFTVFAPPNGAFSGLNTGAFTGDDGSQPLAADIISYHAILGEVLAADVPNDERQSVEGTNLTLRQFADGAVEVNGIPVTTADIQVRNGVIHLIDGVLLQSLNIAQRATVEPTLTTLAAAVGAADASVNDALTDESGTQYTVFAPTNAAFEALDVDDVTADQALVTDLLNYHVIAGQAIASGDITNNQTATTVEGGELTFNVASDGSVTVNGVSVTTTDIQTANGVVHVIDGVLLSELNATQRVVADPAFSTLQTALEAAGEASTLEGAGPFTVFAPTNDAFVAALDADDSGAVESGELPAAADLSDILLYHVIAGSAVASTELSDGQTETTATDSPDGNVLSFGVNGGVTVNPDDEAASVVTADVEVDNGVVHVIDTVLIPGDQSSGGGN